MNPFVSHPSVRIKGTENNYEPITCPNKQCPKSWPHMHCPFCVKTEVFADPVILKAHYRVKHVDKGIEFAGLKILRCCEQCDIVGTIKGTKEFKGAHWHCYKCRNGFTRRDEAIKHYRTHFRNPSTTFQIQVAQDINQSPAYSVRDEHQFSVSQDISLMETVENVISIQPSSPMESLHADCQQSEKSSAGEIQVSVAANETVDTCDGQTIMFIQDPVDDTQVRHVVRTSQIYPSSITSTPIMQKPEGKTERNTGHWRHEKSLLEIQIREIKEENSLLIAEKQQLKDEYEAQLDDCRAQIQLANEEILNYQKRESELLNQLKIPLNDQINELLSDLKTQHEELLHHHLAQIRRMYLQQLQEELGTQHKLSTDGTHLISVKDMHISMEQGEGSDNIITNDSNTNSVVLSTGGVYTSISRGSINNDGIVLTSDGLMSGAGQNSPLFVVAESALRGIKVEQGHMDSGRSLMDENLLEGDDSSTSLVQYTDDSQQVLPSHEDSMNEEILIHATKVSDLEMEGKEDSISHDDDNSEVESQNLTASEKRKLNVGEYSDDLHRKAKQKKFE